MSVRDALRIITDAFESKCESWDEWCGSVTCPKCGSAATIISGARAILAEPEWLSIPETVDTSRAPFDGRDVLAAWEAPNPAFMARGIVRYEGSSWLSRPGDWTKYPTFYQLLSPLPAAPEA